MKRVGKEDCQERRACQVPGSRAVNRDDKCKPDGEKVASSAKGSREKNLSRRKRRPFSRRKACRNSEMTRANRIKFQEITESKAVAVERPGGVPKKALFIAFPLSKLPSPPLPGRDLLVLSSLELKPPVNYYKPLNRLLVSYNGSFMMTKKTS